MTDNQTQQKQKHQQEQGMTGSSFIPSTPTPSIASSTNSYNRNGPYHQPSASPSPLTGRRPSLSIPPLLSGSSPTPLTASSRTHLRLSSPNPYSYSSSSSPPLSPRIPPPPSLSTNTNNTTATSSPSSSSFYEKAQQSAMDAALAHEKQRIQNLELQEREYTTLDEFRAALKRERQHSKHLAMELASLKCVAVTSTLEAEIHEEGRINCLMRRLDGLQKEKGRIILELEREEEMVRFVSCCVV